MGLKYFHKTESSTFAELCADRGHPGPKILRRLTGSTFKTFVDSLPRVKNSANINIDF